MTFFKISIILFFISFVFFSCTSKQSKIDALTNKIELAETNLDDFSEDEWNRLINDLRELRNDFVKNKDSYSTEQ